MIGRSFQPFRQEPLIFHLDTSLLELRLLLRCGHGSPNFPNKYWIRLRLQVCTLLELKKRMAVMREFENLEMGNRNTQILTYGTEYELSHNGQRDFIRTCMHAMRN